MKNYKTGTIYMRSYILLFFSIIILGPGKPATGNDVQFRIVTHENEVHIYHTKRLPAGYGFNIYRQDSPGGEFRLLNQSPVTRARSSGELQSRLGRRYPEIIDFFEAESAGELWLFLQSRYLETMIAVSLFPELAAGMGMLYIDETARVGSEVTYRLEFVDLMNRQFDQHITRQVKLEPSLPAAPSGLRAENEGGRVTLHWHYPRVAPEDDDKVIRFYVYRVDSQTGNPELISEEILLRNNAHDDHFYFFTSPVVNVTEQYLVTAADITGQQSLPSEMLSYEIVHVALPPVVEDVRVMETPGNHAQLTWSPSAGTVITGYHIYRTDDLSLPFRQLTSEPLPAGETVYVDIDVAGGRTYFYHVTAVNEIGHESEMGALVMTRISDITPPPPPKDLTARFDTGSGRIYLEWEIEEVTSDLKSFIILRSRIDNRLPAGFSRVNPADTRDLSWVDTGEGGQGFQEGATYRYVVYSSDHAENYSDTVSISVEIPLFTPPDPPSGLLAVNDRGLRVNLSWSASPSVTAQEYIIYRGNGDDLAKLAWVPLTQRFYRDETAEPGNTYVYSVSAADRAGNESIFSTADTILFGSTNPPRSVRNLQAVERNGGIYMRWERVPGNDLAGYRVYRSDLSTGVFELVHESLITETEFFDPGGDAGMWYRVRAVDNSGNESRPGSAVRPLTPKIN